MFYGREDLRHANETYEYTQEELLEVFKCAEDVVYFAENYCYIITLSKGKELIKLWDFQKELLKTLSNTPKYDKFKDDGVIRNNNIIFTPRQVGKSTIAVIDALHYALFNKDKSIYLLSNNMAGALDLMARMTLMYEMLPQFLQIGLTELNKKTMVFGNGSSIRSKATTASAVRGRSINRLILDEFAFIDDKLADEFKKSVFPTIVSAENPLDSKIIIISTANKLNHFYHALQKAKIGKSTYVPFEVKWNQVPGRDEAFRKRIIDSEGIEYWEQEFACFGKDSTIEVLDTTTNMIANLTMEEFYNYLLNQYKIN